MTRAALVLALLVALPASGARAQSTPDAAAADDPRADARAWFEDARFGLFLHWGVYSVIGKGEWVMNNDGMTVAAYEPWAARFNPVAYDPDAWVRLAAEAGVRYITITSKHHDGFALWDSKVSDFDVVDRSPYGRDLLLPLAEACRRHGLKLFFYHSHLDWRHPDYFPRGKTGRASGRPESGNFDRYLDYLDAQLTELLSGRYGALGGIWFDGWWDQHLDEQNKDDVRTHVDWRLERTYALIHRLQPQALIGNNHHVAPFPGEDFQIVERDLPGQNNFGYNTTAVSGLPLETCDTMNRSWGFNASDHDYKSPTELIHYLVRAAGHGANLLLNVGPTPEGTFPPEAVERLQAMGRWTRAYGETIYGTRRGPVAPQPWGVSTARPGAVYVHVLDAAAPATLALPGTDGLRVARATRFGTDEAVPFRVDGGTVVLDLSATPRDTVDTIVTLHLQP